jgi:DNA-binding GntR family transcriptional regulator
VNGSAGLEQDRALLDRTSTAQRVAGILRERIMEGQFRPGTRLSEETITSGLSISRNTLREAFRILTHEKLLVHELNRGVFVRVLDTDDLRDLYRVRRLIECSAIRDLKEIPPAAAERLEAAVRSGEKAAEENRWTDVGTANLRFHQAIVSLIGSPRIDEMMDRVWAELRLVWAVIDNPMMVHEPFVIPNRHILNSLLNGDPARAVDILEHYLADAEQKFVDAYAAR